MSTFSKKVLNSVLIGGLSIGLMACGTTTKTITFKTADGKVVDQKWERKDASHAMAPSTAALFDYNERTGEVVTEHYVAGGTPLEQAAPIVSAGLLGAAAIEAADRREGDVTNVSQQQNQGQHQYAYADGGDAIALSAIKNQVSNDVYAKFVNCNVGLQIGGKKYHRGGC